MPLNEAQRAAVEYLDGPLLVLAGPGTGKTQLLSSKVEYILKNTDTSPENILCLTFTESGAQNMRDRLYSMIGSAASKVQIHTYHAFGSDILAQYKNYATTFSRDLDSAIDGVTQYKLIENIQGTLDPFDILKKANINDLIETISSAKSARLTGHDLEAIAKDNIATSEKLNPLLNDCLKNLKRAMKLDVGLETVYYPLLEALKTTEKSTKIPEKTEKASETTPEPIPKSIEKEAITLARELEEVIEKAKTQEKPSISPLTTWKNKRFELDENGDFRLKNRVANLKLLSLSHVMQEYENYLATSGLFDFSDMIQQAIEVLKTDTGFKLTLEERYQYILLDEFQDTNAAQAELIYLLTDYENPQVMAVGDDDQAIFAFQGALSSNLRDFKKHYGAASVTLVKNYRSQSEILDLSAKIRTQITESYSKSENEPKDLSAFKQGSASISRHEFIESSAEYHWVAESVENLIKSGVKQSEIAIITPKHKYVAPLLPYLKAYDNIDISYEKRDNLFLDPRMHEILTLARFIFDLCKGRDPSDKLLEILSFPYLEIAPLAAVEAVEAVRNKKSGENPLLTLGASESKLDPKIKDFANFTAELSGLAENTPLELVLDYLIGVKELPKTGQVSHFLEFYAQNAKNPKTNQNSDFSTFELYEHLFSLRSAIIRHTSEELLKLEHLITFVDDYTSANAPLVNTSPYRDSADAVQILTAHKSKGLEFEHVFIIATDDHSWGNAKGNNNFLSLPQNLVQIRHTGVTEDERLRLFFVALTRAKSHLYLTSSLKDFSGKSPARLEYLAEYEAENGEIISPYLPENSKIVEKHYENLPEDQKLADLATSWLSTYSRPEGKLRPLLLSRLENYKLTATDLTTFIDLAYAGPQVFYEQKVLRAPSESYSESLVFGNLIHATFEKVTNDKLSEEKALEFFREQVKSTPIPLEDVEEILEKGEKTIHASLEQFGDLLRADSAHAEVNLYHEHLALPGSTPVPLTGKIDHIQIDEKNKTIEVYDFKTSNYKNYRWGSHPTLYKYMLQLGFYKLLLNLSPTYSRYKVTKAHILFVTPDAETGTVHDKVYEYSETDETELINLARAVYAHARTLDFLDNPDLFVTPDPEKGIKDIKEFIELVLDTAPKI